VTDSSINNTGAGGFSAGAPTATPTPPESTSDNFAVDSRLIDAKGGNTGDYFNGRYSGPGALINGLGTPRPAFNGTSTSPP